MIDIVLYEQKLKVLELYMGLWIHVQCSAIKRMDWMLRFFEEHKQLPWSGTTHNIPSFDQFYEAWLKNQHKMKMQ